MDEEAKSSDVIEISDDSCEAIFDSGAGTSGSGTSSVKRRLPDSDDDDDSESSDDVQFIEEESESEPEYDCDLWDEDCIIVKAEVTTNFIQGIHHTKFISLLELNDIKRIKLGIELNEQLNDEASFKTIKENYLNDNAFEEKNCELITDPWKVLVINNIIQDDAILDKVRQEFYEIDWNIRTMDLYEFSQSEALRNIQEEYISLVYDFLKGDLMSWVSTLTGMELVQVSATCSFYSDTDFLLVHDDQRGTRAVAFVLYLTGKEGWCIDWGGCLQLLNADEKKQPLKVTRSVAPKHNRLVLFPVSETSYHQVEEVQCKNFCRLSINGWFHTKEPPTFKTPVYQAPADGLYAAAFTEPVDDATDLEVFVDDGYLVEETVTSIQEYIEEHSEMSLELYFNEEQLSAVVKDIQSGDIKWQPMGPPNRRNYENISTGSEQHLPSKLKEFLTMLKSKQFFACLDQYTGLDLRRMKWELQRWTRGSYALITQDNVDRLDVIFCLGDTAVVGGKTQYVTLEDEVQSALITTGCEVNCLNMVYGDTARYTSLISKYSKSSCFYMFVASYFEDGDEKKGSNDACVVAEVDLTSREDAESAATELISATATSTTEEVPLAE